MSKITLLKRDWRLGARCAFDLVRMDGRICLRKKYPITRSSRNNREMTDRMKQERLARHLFAQYPWMSPIVSSRGAPHSITLPFYKHRLGGVRWPEHMDFLPRADSGTKRAMARQLVRAMFDMYEAGYAHCDLHPNNLFWENGQIIIIDFESMRRYPTDRPKPPFPESFDVAHDRDARTMLGMRRKWRRKHVVGYGGHILGVPTGELLAEFEEDLGASLEEASRYWHTALKPGGRHLARRHGQPTVYTSIDLPHTKIAGARDSAERLGAFHATWARGADLRGRSILDLGCNAGGMLFAAQKYRPGQCLGVEHDADKVRVANRIAAYNGLNTSFISGDLDDLVAKDISDKPFDVVFSFAVEAHLKDRPKFYRLLGEMTGDMLYFETNAMSPPDEVERLLSEEGGFAFVDRQPAAPNSGKRVLFLARK